MHGIPRHIPEPRWFSDQLRAAGSQVTLIQRGSPTWTPQMEASAADEDRRFEKKHAIPEPGQSPLRVLPGQSPRRRSSTVLTPITHAFVSQDPPEVHFCRGGLGTYHIFRRHWRRWAPGWHYPVMPKRPLPPAQG